MGVVALDARDLTVTAKLAPWCAKGQSVALVGSSGVGKTTLRNALTGEIGETQGIREDDARGRHTTTGRSLHVMPSGGWLIDTPGMRGLGVADVVAGINATFPEISELEGTCRFRDCKHEAEPGCAVLAAIAAGDVDPERLKRFQKLRREDAHATETIAQARERSRKTGKMHNEGKKRSKHKRQ
jgi:ribosome biogenesis GTPase